MLIYHVDMNSVAFRVEAIRKLVRRAAELGYDAILWELADKVRWECYPGGVHPEALTKAEFRAILAEASQLGLESIPLMQVLGHVGSSSSQTEDKPSQEALDGHDASCPETQPSLEGLFHEYLGLFGSVRSFHLGGDEVSRFGEQPGHANRNRADLGPDFEAIYKELREKGIRPCCWHDIILSDADLKSVEMLPRDFLLFLCDYTATVGDFAECEKRMDTLLSLGFEVVLCGSVQSAGEDPFVGSFRRHADNCGTLAYLVHKYGLPGLCATSWSIWGAPKGLQISIMDFASRCYHDNSLSSLDGIRFEIRERYLGVAKIQYIHDLMCCPPGLPFFTSIGWTGSENAPFPGDGCAKRFFDKEDKEMAVLRGKVTEELAGVLYRFQVARKELCMLPSRTPIVSLLLQGAELKVFYLRSMLDILEGRPINRVTAEAARFSTEAFYGKEQRRISARRFSEIVWKKILQFAS